ncbi:MAG: sulfotransferase domain-containing protein [Gammaproteobacteria bacterium]
MTFADTPTLTRPTSVAEIRARLQRFRTDASREAALAFRPRPHDVFIATYAKSGTTWMQQIVHCLRTGGDMGFAEVTEVVPWIEGAVDLGLDITAPQRAAPRAFKTHLTWNEVPKGARYIWMVRNPADVAVSFFHFFEGWFFESGSISLDEFTSEFFLGGSLSGSYWGHLCGWWQVRDRHSVLALSFEDIKAEPKAAIERVGRFIGVALSQPLVDLTAYYSSIEYMRAHADRFDDRLVRAARDSACGLPPGGAASKVRAGNSGDGDALSADVTAALDARWREVVLPATGFENYGALRAALAYVP